ncbi:hypothetical protein [Inconstantimicrobium porci]|uniref:Uncharacterized protein n=1 Tax=Inconstantimicrobium porci TaxID=2652291 RepID=A0A7X2T1T8_9CLOT|nr:hypothetical protein [Inconstantimicrobium porci]MSR92041.1 hypothetical protein [Inconstantimicrobium porci]
MYDVLNDGGYLLLSVYDGNGKNNKKSFGNIDGEDYYRNFIEHSKMELLNEARNLFDYTLEINPDANSKWKNYIFKKC